jgi:hypothetical protein
MLALDFWISTGGRSHTQAQSVLPLLLSEHYSECFANIDPVFGPAGTGSFDSCTQAVCDVRLTLFLRRGASPANDQGVQLRGFRSQNPWMGRFFFRSDAQRSEKGVSV